MAGTNTTPGLAYSDKVISRIEQLERKVRELERLVEELRSVRVQ